MNPFTGLRLYAAIGVGVVIALLLAWALRVDHLRASHLKERDSARAGLAISETSLKQCRGIIDDNNLRVIEANARLNEARQQAAADKARADERWSAQKGRVAALEASARDDSQEPCKVSQRAATALEGL